VYLLLRPLPGRQAVCLPTVRGYQCTLRLLLIVAALRPALANPAPPTYCPAGASSTCDSVLVLCVSAGACNNVQATLQSTGAFATVDVFRINTTNVPTVAQLAPYHAVLVNSVPSNGVLLGNRLADYYEQGGGVIIAANANFGGNWLECRELCFGLCAIITTANAVVILLDASKLEGLTALSQ
jgi:hypothetical protein